MKNLSLKEQFVELRAKGHSYSSIAKELKKSKQTIINWSKELQFEVSNLKQLYKKCQLQFTDALSP